MAESYQLKAVYWTTKHPCNEKQTCIHLLSTIWSNTVHILLHSSYIRTCFSGGKHHHHGRQHHRPKKNTIVGRCLSCHTGLSHLPCMYKQHCEICIHLLILHLLSVSSASIDTKTTTGLFSMHKTLTNSCDMNK